MEAYKQKIEEKYRLVSKLPEQLMGFTVPIRRRAVDLLNLPGGASVLDVGCGSGASFPCLIQAVGESGKVIGVEPSHSMISVARQRIKQEGWKNIVLHENTIEEIEEMEIADGALLFAMHDVFNSMPGLMKIHALLKDGARIVCVGPKTQTQRKRRVLNPFLRLLFKRMAISQENLDRPWRMVESLFSTEEILEEKGGLIFIYVGRK